MNSNKSNSYGNIDISLEAISSAAANTTIQCYGVVGMAKKNSFNEIDLFMIVAFGVRITEVVSEVQKKVKYDLEQKFNIKFKAINVYVQGIKNI